ncbi:hypothetical protein L6452_18915 [Arctium lappa]|uniref:Uncharacterized protein n=1 Tax=Arctium lappa TaxID=4217 RepID=A0ACB9B901_ARCLA|nr:hypothetical protein L6452_18915 [Arctium lappa]
MVDDLRVEVDGCSRTIDGDRERERESATRIARTMATPQGTQEHIVAQINIELNAARARIGALTNQHSQAVEEIEFLRNQNASNAAGHSHGQSGFSIP